MNYRIEDFPFIEHNKILYLNDDGKELGYLEFTPPGINDKYINIQNIKVTDKRKGIGTGLIEYLKEYAREKYNSIIIRAMDVDPIENTTKDELKQFYIANGFQIYEDENGDVSASFSF